MSEAFLKWFEDKYGHKYGEYEEDVDVFAAYTAGLIRAAEIANVCASRRQSTRAACDAIRKEADNGTR